MFLCINKRRYFRKTIATRMTCKKHCKKSVRIRSFSGPCFPAFELNTERYSVSLRIQSECGKIRTRKTPNTDTLHAAKAIIIPPIYQRLFYRSNCGICFTEDHSCKYKF